MTPSASLVDFAYSFAAKAEADLASCPVHPSAAAIICEYLTEIRAAALRIDAAEVSRLATRINEKIASEVAWHRHCLRRAQLDDNANALIDSETAVILAGLQNGLSVRASLTSLQRSG